MSSTKTNNNQALMAKAADAMEEHDQVIQFFQAALTRPAELELTKEEQQGLFTVMEWQRDSLRSITHGLLLKGDKEN